MPILIILLLQKRLKYQRHSKDQKSGGEVFGFVRFFNLDIYLQISQGEVIVCGKNNTYNPHMAEPLSHLTPDAQQLQETPPRSALSQQEHRNFMLTQAQRIYIQAHLPKKFTLVQVSEGGSRINCSSRALLEDSLVFIERKRGRPQGSTRKHLTCKVTIERKSERIASASRPNYLISASKSNLGSFSSGQEKEEEEGMAIALGEVNLNGNIQKTQENDHSEVKKQQHKQTPKVTETKIQEPSLPPKQETVQTEPPKKIIKKKSSKKVPLPLQNTPEEELPQTPIRKQEQFKDFAKQLKTQPPNTTLIPTPTFQAQNLIIRRLKSHKEILPFLQPVDQLRDGAPSYYKEICSPIDLQTIEFKLTNGIYKESEEFHADVRLMWANAKSYNKKNEFMQKATEQLEAFYLQLITRAKCGRKKKRQEKKSEQQIAS